MKSKQTTKTLNTVGAAQWWRAEDCIIHTRLWTQNCAVQETIKVIFSKVHLFMYVSTKETVPSMKNNKDRSYPWGLGYLNVHTRITQQCLVCDTYNIDNSCGSLHHLCKNTPLNFVGFVLVLCPLVSTVWGTGQAALNWNPPASALRLLSTHHNIHPKF